MDIDECSLRLQDIKIFKKMVSLKALQLRPLLEIEMRAYKVEFEACLDRFYILLW